MIVKIITWVVYLITLVNIDYKGVCHTVYTNGSQRGFWLFRQLRLNDKLSNKHGIILPVILNYLNLSVDKEAELLVQYASFVTILSLFVLFSFINIVIYIAINYLLDKNKIETKLGSHPRIIKIIKHYQNVSKAFIVIEFVTIIFILIVMIVISFILLKNTIK
uniref:Uncharacterized protein n=1 Tax=Porodaedalea pini TaxID=108901 RepID=A0A5B9R955_9AGAM|nr:hypothetical protein PPIT_000100 [Porodaedalea pini]QEG56988.1 hypothetical protein PPIT_000100 [Porodaedalea pini]